MPCDSSTSASNPLPTDGLPLITCTECGLRKVVRRKSKQPWSLGHVFYCCPLNKEEDYAEELWKLGVLYGGKQWQKEDAGDPRRQQDGAKKENARMKDDAVNEVARLLKSICLLCVCILVVQVVMLIGQMLK
ncbi:hypothetical protein HU200_040981 [Digitaria exilis]|uniref:Zinc finger GRF-type domain-containing protein n=1 Tax=Digitaria exilis TaxID=1010633 RepID=A0A835B8F1_9POAL|nr:hypothetical protein HU200_040981 [Digitaria exilis]